METIEIHFSEIEKIRDRIILDAHENNTLSLGTNLENTLDLIKDGIGENDQKAVNQIVHCINFFRRNKKTFADRKVKDLKTEISKKIKNIVRDEIKRVPEISFDTWLSKVGLSEVRLKRVIENLSSLQITTGCSNFCRRCNEWALFHPRKHFSYDGVKSFLSLISKSSNRDFNLYCASDPLDWKSGNRDITDIHKLLQGMDIKPNFGILTKVPRGKESLLKKLYETDGDVGISITGRNRKRVENILKNSSGKVFKQHELDELTIAAGLDEDFSTIKPSITDSYGIEITADGVFQIIPTFTSALSLTGQARIPVTKDTSLFIKQITGRNTLAVPYFKPLIFVNTEGEELRNKDLIDPQIENIILDRSKEDADPPGMMNIREFFRSFDRDAVMLRKNICSKVLADAESEFCDGKDFNRYKEHYLKSCDLKECSQMKVDAAVFLLKQIRGYIDRNPVRSGIAKHLRSENLQGISRRFVTLFKDNIENTLFYENENSFPLFETLLLKLLSEPENTHIQRFIEGREVYYDHITDYFIGKA